MATIQIKDLTLDNAPAVGDFLVTQKASNDATVRLSVQSLGDAYIQGADDVGADRLAMANGTGEGLAFIDTLTYSGEVLTLNCDMAHTGNQVGFHGAEPTPQAVIPLTYPTIQDVIDVLVAKGLARQEDYP